MYKSKLTIKETQKAIQQLKFKFQEEFSKILNLTRVSAPLFVDPKTGLNDGLNGEKAVHFHDFKDKTKLEIVHSLAKWKRHSLDKYGFHIGEGVYTDMNAIRQQEILSNIHSYYVDQWDWEKSISKTDRNQTYLRNVVKSIFQILKDVEEDINKKYPVLTKKMPEEIFFIDSQELENLYPNLTPEEREYALVKEKKAIFVEKVGYPLKSGVVHSKRAFDYDDWNLNGDIIVYHPGLDQAIELSSMGIRVDREAILKQSQKSELEVKNISQYHKQVVEETISFSIGGGIGQSRVCMFFLEKAHIGEVQVSFWSDKTREELKAKGINLL